MSVEGMWVLLSNAVPELEELNVTDGGGILVLETGRIFGGDSVMAHTGEYTVEGARITAKVRSWNWNNVRGQNVFGLTTPIDHNVNFSGEIHNSQIFGEMSSDQAPGHRLKVYLRKIAELP